MENEKQAAQGSELNALVRPIANLPDDLDVKCSVCNQWVPIVLELRGNANCYYCGNEISLCGPCAKRMMQELKSIGWA